MIEGEKRRDEVAIKEIQDIDADRQSILAKVFGAEQSLAEIQSILDDANVSSERFQDDAKKSKKLWIVSRR